MKHWVYIVFTIVFSNAYAAEPDTSLNNFQYNLNDYRYFYHSLPEIGSSTLTNQNNYLFNNSYNSIHFYKRKFIDNSFIYDTAYTRILFFTGSNKTQYIDVNHSQKIGNNFSYFSNYNRSSTESFFQNALKKNTNFNTGINYTSRNNLYSSIVLFEYSKFNYEENGGLRTDTSNFLITKRDFVETNLQEARNIGVNRVISIKQNIRLLDSIHNKYSLVANLYSNLSDSKYRYTDISSSNTLRISEVDNSSNPIFDSIYCSNIQNVGGFKFKLINASIDINVGNEQIRYKQDVLGFSLYNNFFNTSGHYKPNTFLNFDYSLFKVFSGYNKGNFDFIVNSRIDIDSLNYLNITLNSKKTNPLFWQENYSSQLYSWSNVFDKIYTNSFLFDYNNIKYRFGLKSKFSIYKNFVYINDSYIPVQNIDNITIVNFILDKHFNFKKWNFYTEQIINYVEGNGISLPFLSSFNSIYYKSSMLNKASDIRIGVDIYYRSEYYGMGYNPELRSFYFQNNVLTGNYPILDFVFASKIKNGRVFFKVTHINADFTGTNYYFVPNYALEGRTFRLGLDWTFWN